VIAELRPKRLLSVGSIVADIRIDVPHLPPRGGDVLGSTASVSAGGGFNILAAAARNGLACAFAGRHGVGPYGTRIRADLAREGIPALLEPSPEGDSGFCVVMVEPQGERTFITSPGVESKLGPRALASLAVESSDAVFVSGYDLCYPALGPAIARWTQTLPAGVGVVVDPGAMVGDIPSDILCAVLANTRILTMNRREAMLFDAAEDLGQIALRALARLAAGALVIVRDGANGCIVAGAGLPDPPVRVQAPPVTMIDSTGAGDAHTGVFLASMAAGLDPVSAARRANWAAAVSVTRRGPATAPTTEELETFLAAAHGRG
jgi:ribokinase